MSWGISRDFLRGEDLFDPKIFQSIAKGDFVKKVKAPLKGQ
jgi:hypothetical protein